MDSSTYLKLKVQSMTKYIHRQTYLDQGFRTEIIGKSNNTHYVSPCDINTAVNSTDCTSSRPAYTSDTNQAIKPFPGCISHGVCAQNALIASDPTIIISGCPFPYVSTSYVSPCKVKLYQATTDEQSKAVAETMLRSKGEIYPLLNPHNRYDINQE